MLLTPWKAIDDWKEGNDPVVEVKTWALALQYDKKERFPWQVVLMAEDLKERLPSHRNAIAVYDIGTENDSKEGKKINIVSASTYRTPAEPTEPREHTDKSSILSFISWLGLDKAG